MYKLIKEKNVNWVMKNTPNLTSSADLLGKNKDGRINDGSFLFYIMPRICGRLLDNNPKKVLSKKSIELRKNCIHKILIKLCPMFLNGKKFHLVKSSAIPTDRAIIFAPNHGFTEDTVSSIMAAEEHAYIMFGSLPQFFNTLNGVGAYLNGSILINRKDKSSRRASVEKAEYALKMGTNLILFPEGVFNKSPNKLLLNFWSGIFRIAKQSNALIVPIVHLKVGDDIYTARLEPFDVNDYVDIPNASNALREIMCTELYSLMETYSTCRREDILNGNVSMHDACEAIISEQVTSAGKYYDYDIETTADYRGYCHPGDVWKNIAYLKKNIANERAIEHAKVYVKEDYQRRF